MMNLVCIDGPCAGQIARVDNEHQIAVRVLEKPKIRDIELAPMDLLSMETMAVTSHTYYLLELRFEKGSGQYVLVIDSPDRYSARGIFTMLIISHTERW